MKRDLYKFLFDQGLEIFVEPAETSGEPDIIATEITNSQKSVIEGKIFDSQKHNKSQIIKGVNQTEIYVRDRQEQVGYLVIYNTGPYLLVVDIHSEAYQLPSIKKNGRNIYILVIDLYRNEKSASVRPSEHIITLVASDFN